MVDVLINCLLKNREIAEELNPSGGVNERNLEIPDGEEGWKTFSECHPVNPATNAMINMGGGTSPLNEDNNAASLQTNPVGLLCEYYKVPLDKVDKALADRYGALNDIWTSVASNSQAGIVNSVSNSLNGTIPVALLPQATEILRNRRLSDSNEISAQEVDNYLKCTLVKQESPEDGELIVPTSSVISSHKSSDIIKTCTTTKSTNAEENPDSPLPIIVKQEQDRSSSPPVMKIRDLPPASTVIAQAYSSQLLPHGYEALTGQYSAASLQYQNPPTTSVYMVASPPEYSRGITEYFTENLRSGFTSTLASTIPAYTDATDTASLVDRYIKQAGYKGNFTGLTSDLPSPDSGIGDTAVTIIAREASGLTQVGEIFDISELSQAQNLVQSEPAPSRPASSHSGSSRKSWHEYGRNAETDKVQIPKLHSELGFKYFLESPISTSQRREDDRITYINKGQFYGITLEYTPDPARPLKSSTVKSVVMLMFREEKPPEEELKAWQFWHSRQHSVKQRILDADTKNSTGIIGQIEEITHNAIAFYWNPLETSAKVNIAVQCLSTDFSNQKGVKVRTGLPLHLQIDTFDEFRECAAPHHRGYSQIKVFCDKGAERKTRDEERRAAKRKLNSASASDTNPPFPGRKKLEEFYHLPCDRSEFYSMSDLLKPPILFTPSDDVDKIPPMELSFYTATNGAMDDQSVSGIDRRDTDSNSSSTYTPPPKKIKLYPDDRVLLYARQESETNFQPLHIYPPTLAGLAKGIQNKYKINAGHVGNIYKRNKKGLTILVDDDIVKHYSNEDACLIEVSQGQGESHCDITLVEL